MKIEKPLFRAPFLALPFLALLISLVLAPLSARAVDVNQIEHDLGTTGVVGWIHGAVAERGIYVFTYRNPDDFFDYIEVSLVGMTSDMESRLATLGRHDKVRVKGKFLKNRVPRSISQSLRSSSSKSTRLLSPPSPIRTKRRFPTISCTFTMESF